MLIRIFYRLAAFAGMLALVTVATDQVLTHNLTAGIYPVDADSIGIPLVMALVKAVVAYVVLLPAAILPSLAKHWHSRTKRTALLGISLMSLLLGLLLCGLNGLSWLDGDHFLISLAWWGFALFAGTIVVIDLRRGYPIKPDQKPPAAPAA